MSFFSPSRLTKPAMRNAMHAWASSSHAQGAALPQHQRGIGMLGFIVGIVVGLAVALAVAVYITKVPTPFTDKSKVKTAEEQAAEEARLKSWNPNAPLASKTPAPTASGYVQPAPTAQAGSTQPGATQPGTTAPDTTTAPATHGATSTPPTTAARTDEEQPPTALGDREQELARARAEAEAKLKADMRAQELTRAKAKAEEEQRAQEQAKANASNDPIGALVQARIRQQAEASGNTAAPAAANTGGGDAFIYYVQVGAFRDPGGADSQKARLSMMGLSPRVNERQQAGRTVYQVRLGPFQSKKDADAARSRVESNGMETALVRVQR